jgi:beta-glucosidase
MRQKYKLPPWSELSLEEQIGQMLVIRASGYCFDQQIRYPIWESPSKQLSRWLGELNLGGVILLGGSALEVSQRVQQLQNWANLPLLIAADIEEGVGQRFSGGTWFPPPLALGAIAATNPTLAQEYACKMGAVTAKEALSIGINWLLAPVVDVNNNPANPVINVRAFGEKPEVVTNLTTAFIKGAQQLGVLTTAKHFPGHGDTSVDSHLELPQLNHSISRLAAVELPPFQGAIAAGVDSVMSGHLLIPAWDSQYPATISKKILSDQLRQQLGFDGLIVTDALIMGGITKIASPETIAVQAIAAGADILLMPSNPEITIKAIADAVRSGYLPRERINQSLQRLWQAKTVISQNTYNPLTELSQAIETVAAILTASNRTGGNLPLHSSENDHDCNLIVVDNLLDCEMVAFYTPAVTIPTTKGYQAKIVDRQTLISIPPQPCLLQLFVRGNPFRGSSGLSPQTQTIYQQLLQQNLIKGLVIYGSPYILDWFLPQLPPELPWVFSYGQMPQAQEIAIKQLFF